MKYLPTYLQNCKHEESTRIPNYTLQTKQVEVHTTLESYNCAATYDQSSTTTNICYASKTRLPILLHSLVLVGAGDSQQRSQYLLFSALVLQVLSVEELVQRAIDNADSAIAAGRTDLSNDETLGQEAGSALMQGGTIPDEVGMGTIPLLRGEIVARFLGVLLSRAFIR